MSLEIKPGQTHIKSKAMVAWAAGEPLKMEEVDVQLPKAGEVLVRIVATGVCHTDAFTLSGDDQKVSSLQSLVTKVAVSLKWLAKA